ncbi:MAG: LysR family transcriptional regulator [Telmatospirillum sp.]|nr:LysR family transcriptional regulator [Telmatospirillum sp.]
MNLTQLRSLVAVAETGSITAAAAAIGVTQSALSQALAGFEAALGVQLLVRERQGATLTAFGEAALPHARAALDHIAAIGRDAATAAGTEGGSLRIAAFPSVFATVLPSLLRRFRILHPGINLIALETDDREVEVWLAEGAIDLGVLLNPAPDRNAVEIGQDEWIAVMPAGHRFARRTSVSLTDLVAEPFVLATGGCHLHARSLASAADLVLADVRIEVRDWASAVALIREGTGVGIIPASALPDSARGIRMARLSPPQVRRFGMAASPARAPSRAATLLLDLAGRHPIRSSSPDIAVPALSRTPQESDQGTEISET